MSRKTFSLLGETMTNPALLAMVLELRRSLRNCKTVLDLGCGHNSPAKFLNHCKIVGLDGYRPDLEKAKARGTHDEYVFGDVCDIGKVLPNRKFDACIALDVIEHLTKEDGWKMLKSMESITTRCVVIFTPNGFIPQFSEDGNLQQHLSGWEINEMQQAGYHVIGMHGPKCMRGEKAVVKYKPRTLWGLASFFCHYVHTRQNPHKAFSIFCTRHSNSDSPTNQA